MLDLRKLCLLTCVFTSIWASAIPAAKEDAFRKQDAHPSAPIIEDKKKDSGAANGVVNAAEVQAAPLLPNLSTLPTLPNLELPNTDIKVVNDPLLKSASFIGKTHGKGKQKQNKPDRPDGRPNSSVNAGATASNTSNVTNSVGKPEKPSVDSDRPPGRPNGQSNRDAPHKPFAGDGRPKEKNEKPAKLKPSANDNESEEKRGKLQKPLKPKPSSNEEPEEKSGKLSKPLSKPKPSAMDDKPQELKGNVSQEEILITPENSQIGVVDAVPLEQSSLPENPVELASAASTGEDKKQILHISLQGPIFNDEKGLMSFLGKPIMPVPPAMTAMNNAFSNYTKESANENKIIAPGSTGSSSEDAAIVEDPMVNGHIIPILGVPDVEVPPSTQAVADGLNKLKENENIIVVPNSNSNSRITIEQSQSRIEAQIQQIKNQLMQAQNSNRNSISLQKPIANPGGNENSNKQNSVLTQEQLFGSLHAALIANISQQIANSIANQGLAQLQQQTTSGDTGISNTDIASIDSKSPTESQPSLSADTENVSNPNENKPETQDAPATAQLENAAKPEIVYEVEEDVSLPSIPENTPSSQTPSHISGQNGNPQSVFPPSMSNAFLQILSAISAGRPNEPGRQPNGENQQGPVIQQSPPSVMNTDDFMHQISALVTAYAQQQLQSHNQQAFVNSPSMVSTFTSPPGAGSSAFAAHFVIPGGSLPVVATGTPATFSTGSAPGSVVIPPNSFAYAEVHPSVLSALHSNTMLIPNPDNFVNAQSVPEDQTIESIPEEQIVNPGEPSIASIQVEPEVDIISEEQQAELEDPMMNSSEHDTFVDEVQTVSVDTMDKNHKIAHGQKLFRPIPTPNSNRPAEIDDNTSNCGERAKLKPPSYLQEHFRPTNQGFSGDNPVENPVRPNSQHLSGKPKPPTSQGQSGSQSFGNENSVHLEQRPEKPHEPSKNSIPSIASQQTPIIPFEETTFGKPSLPSKPVTASQNPSTAQNSQSGHNNGEGETVQFTIHPIMEEHESTVAENPTGPENPLEVGEPTETGKPAGAGKPTEVGKPAEAGMPTETGKPAGEHSPNRPTGHGGPRPHASSRPTGEAGGKPLLESEGRPHEKPKPMTSHPSKSSETGGAVIQTASSNQKNSQESLLANSQETNNFVLPGSESNNPGHTSPGQSQTNAKPSNHKKPKPKPSQTKPQAGVSGKPKPQFGFGLGHKKPVVNKQGSTVPGEEEVSSVSDESTPLRPKPTGWLPKWPSFAQLYQNLFGARQRADENSEGDICATPTVNLRDTQDYRPLCGAGAGTAENGYYTCEKLCTESGFNLGTCQIDDSCICSYAENSEVGLKMEYYYDRNMTNWADYYPTFDSCSRCSCSNLCTEIGYFLGVCGNTCYCARPFQNGVSLDLYNNEEQRFQ